MKATFLVSLRIGADQSLASVAASVADSLSDDHDVIMVKPWQRPKSAPNAQGQAVLRHFIDNLPADAGNNQKTSKTENQ